MSEEIVKGGELAELLPNAVEPEDLYIEVVQGEHGEVAAVKLGDDVGRCWLYVPVSPEEMREVEPGAIAPPGGYERQRGERGTFAARQSLVDRLVEALMQAQDELQRLNGSEASPALAAIAGALEAANAELNRRSAACAFPKAGAASPRD